MLSGEAGIGKSRLVQSIRQQIGDGPSFRLHFQCSPHHTSSALYPIIQHLARTSGFALDDAPDTKLDKLEHVLRLAGEEIDAVAPLFAALMTNVGDLIAALGIQPAELDQRRNRIRIRRQRVHQTRRLVILEPVAPDTPLVHPVEPELIGRGLQDGLDF